MACDEHACHCDVVESVEGDMVDYDDYAALEARCAALAAENAKKSRCLGFFASVIKSGESWTRFCQHEYNEAQETPATDVFLAEVRAAAVDEVCLKISNAIVNCYQDEQVGLDAAATICGDFAAQLRKGGAA
ncbi:TPA: hypothetical protein JAX37_000096 [Enterobacter cloacae]|nr:hypothetical protein [Enterobacter cloacae]